MAITRSQMNTYAGKIEDNNAKMNLFGTKVVGTTNTTSTKENTAVFNALKNMLDTHYTPQIAREAMDYILNEEFADEFNAKTHVESEGLTGDQISDIISRADTLRNTFIDTQSLTSPTTTKNLIMNKMKDEMKWPGNLGNREKEAITDAVEDVVKKFITVHGSSADKVVTLVANMMAKRVSELVSSRQRDQISNSLKGMTLQLKQAIVNDSHDAAINGDHSMGNITRALAPPLSNGKTDFAAIERGLRFSMVKSLVDKLATTKLTLTVKTQSKEVDLQSVFNPKTNVWKDLSSGDREKVVREFMKLHAETHGYPNDVVLQLNQSSDSAARKPLLGTRVMNLRDQTMESNDPTLIFKTLSHELTHSFQQSLADGTNSFQDQIPPVVKDRLAFDLGTREFTKLDHHVRDFSHSADLYVRDYTERAAVESEFIAGQLLLGSNASLTDFVKVTKDIQDGMAGHIRMTEWTQSLEIQSNLAQNSETQLQEVRNLTDAASTALEIGSIGDNMSYLKEGELLLNNIMYDGMERSQIAKFSAITVGDLSNLLGRVRSSPEAKTFARLQLPRFQLALARSTTDRETMLSTTSKGVSNLRELLKGDFPKKDKVAFHGQIAEMMALRGKDTKTKINSIQKEAVEIANLVNGSEERFDYDKALSVLTDLLEHAERLANQDSAYDPNIQAIKLAMKEVKEGRDKL